MTAKFEQVVAAIQQRVNDGFYHQAQKLPSEYDLAKEFMVSRLTVRKAIEQLVRAQVLVKDPGKGTYVMSDADKVESGRMGLQGFTEAAEAYGKSVRTELLQFTPEIKPTAAEAKALALTRRPDPTVAKLVRRRFWDDTPMTIEHIILPARYVATATEADLTGSLFTWLEQQVDIAYSHQEIEAVLVTKTLSRQLAVPVGDPLLRVRSITYTAAAEPILYDTSFYRADKYAFKSTLMRQN